MAAQTENDSRQGSSPYVAPQINLPKGGGAIRGIGEKFAANPVTGTGGLTVPIAVSPGRSGFTPNLSVAYDSGTGNGPFGMGCSLNLPSITRKAEKGIPLYDDLAESDVFILSGSEDLVPVLERGCDGCWTPREYERDSYRVKHYRPRVEGLFARIERWTRLCDGDVHWRSISKDNVLSVYGDSSESRIQDPCDPSRVFSWLISRSYDDKGNAMVYEYVGEDDRGVDFTKASERRRSRTANRYLKRVRYGNRQPQLLDPKNASFRAPHIPAPPIGAGDWMFEVVFDYGDECYDAAGPDERNRIYATYDPEGTCRRCWPVRSDPFSAYRTGFEVRTYRLCRRVLMLHRFPRELGADYYLVRSTEFEYTEKPTGSFVTRVVQSGYRLKESGRYLKKSMPPIDLSYTSSPLEDPDFQGYVLREADMSTVSRLPGGIDEANYRWLDLDGEGINGVLTEQGAEWFYNSNLGDGHFGPPELVSPRPSTAALVKTRQQFMDIGGDGNLDLVDFAGPTPGFYERTPDRSWATFRVFPKLPSRDWNDPNLRFADVTGDGIADILVTEDDAISWHAALGKEGFAQAVRVHVPLDDDRGARVVFSDGTQSMFLADMSGDGMSDLVRIRNGEVCYWPNLGYGRFGAKVSMDHAPWFDREDLFDQRRIRLADTDGSGTTDIIYFGASGVRIFLNQGGNGWSGARTIERFPVLTMQRSAAVVDLLGRGTACLLWSSQLPGDAQRPLLYIDLMCGQKPHMLTRVVNNLGAETAIEYASSTEFYLEDKAAGTPWITRLPFPVHVVKRVVTFDHVSRNRFVTRYSYHHGHYDGIEREFRGFARMDQVDTEELGALGFSEAALNEAAASNVPPVLTRTWFHTGAFLDGARISKQLEHEYYREGETVRGESPLRPEHLELMLLPDTILPHGLSPDEEREACRALKGSMLRQEVYALDGSQDSTRPYTVSENNFTVRMEQPKGPNRFGVFFSHAREAITFQYERKLYAGNGYRRADPRVSHVITLAVDAFGNVIRTVTAGYGRRFADPSELLTDEDRAKQTQIHIMLRENHYTKPLDRLADAFRTPAITETHGYELIHCEPASCQPGLTNLFRFHEMAEIVAAAGDGHHDLPYEDLDAAGAVLPGPYLRLLDRSRTLYRANALDRLLDPGELQSLALPGELYKLTFTPGLLAAAYGDRLPDPDSVLGPQGGYVDLDGDGHWWAPSGRVFYSPDENDTPAAELAFASSAFFLAARYHDPFGNVTILSFDPHYLTTTETRDAAGNTTKADFDYRVLAPYRITDSNGNRSETAFDALGLVVGKAVMGKPHEHVGDSLTGYTADLEETTILAHITDPLRAPDEVLASATTRLIYDMYAFMRTGAPATAYTIARETHVSDLKPTERTRVQHSFSYSDGFGREIQKKVQAEPDPSDVHGAPRWTGTGWVIFNNKGKPVRQFEPFFSKTNAFEFAAVLGVSPVLLYDPPGRTIATIHPNHSYEKVVFDPWGQQSWDANDTVLLNPSTDPDVAPVIGRMSEHNYHPTWYEQRRKGALGPGERDAANKAAQHYGTPAVAFADGLGRTFLTAAHNRFRRKTALVEEHYLTRLNLDIQGRQRSVTDALGRVAMSYVYDLQGAVLYHDSIDAGPRWILNDCKGQTILAFDGRGHRIRREYDVLRRPTNTFVRFPDGVERLSERLEYGEAASGASAANLRGRAFRQFDDAGILTNHEYDFKGNLRRSSRQLISDYRDILDWSRDPHLESDVFPAETVFDGLNRPILMIAPDDSAIRPSYNEAGLLHKLEVRLKGTGDFSPYVTNINHNAKGQRTAIGFGNSVLTKNSYDPLTFRLTRVKSTRDRDEASLQDLGYVYDPVGNVTSFADGARQTIYFRNQVVSPGGGYVYDSTYRLSRAEGREHVGHAYRPVESHISRAFEPLPGDGHAMQRYREEYDYDAVGNILELAHAASQVSWKARYVYADAPSSNRLVSRSASGVTDRYAYDAHGNTVRMPHLVRLEWDFQDRLASTQTQYVTTGSADKTYYQYDAAGQRVRKITEGRSGNVFSQRVYLGVFEIYREYCSGSVSLERISLHVMDDTRRIALVESSGGDVTIRYQFEDHLGSACLELDEKAAILSYEEYYPYGGTSFQAGRSQAEVSLKRYRYTGRERDEETGFNFHGARYYAPWIGRWVSPDPKGLVDGPNLYAYARDNPITFTDLTGTVCDPTTQSCIDPTEPTPREEAEQRSIPEEHLSTPNVPLPQTGGSDTPAQPPPPAEDPWYRFTYPGFYYQAGKHDAFQPIGRYETGYIALNIPVNLYFTVSNVLTIPVNAVTELAAVPDELILAAGGSQMDVESWHFASLMVGVGEVNALTEMAQASRAMSELRVAATAARTDLIEAELARMAPVAADEAGQLKLATNLRSTFQFGHNATGMRVGETMEFFHQTGEVELSTNQLLRTAQVARGGFPTMVEATTEARFAGRGYDILSLEAQASDAQRALAWGRVLSRMPSTGSYSILTNSCTTTSIELLEAGGLNPPFWARSPATLQYWFRMQGGK